MVSAPIVTIVSIYVLAGSTMVTPASMCRSKIRCCMIARAAASSTLLLMPMTSTETGSLDRFNSLAGACKSRDAVGEIELALRIVGGESCDSAAQVGLVEAIDPRIDFVDRELFRRRVASLHDAHHLAAISNDSTECRRQRHPGGAQHDGSFLCALGLARCNEQVARHERHIGTDDKDGCSVRG